MTSVLKRLDHVRWLGGSACAGKTSVARRLAERHGLAVYHADDHAEAHRRRAHPERHATFRRVMDLAPEALWARPAAEQAAELLTFYREEFELVVEDLAATAGAGPVVAEGAGLLPGLVLAAAPPGRALWLIAAGDFRRRVYPGRGPWVAELLARSADPERAWEAWMARDDLVAAAIAGEARRLGGRVLAVDGDRPVESIADRAARRLAAGLRGR
jgi:hypothetical protein